MKKQINNNQQKSNKNAGRSNPLETIVIILDGRLDIKYIHQIEKEIDIAMTKVGFTRTNTSKEKNKIILNYKQYISIPE